MKDWWDEDRYRTRGSLGIPFGITRMRDDGDASYDMNEAWWNVLERAHRGGSLRSFGTFEVSAEAS
jgi:hypothetical protein